MASALGLEVTVTLEDTMASFDGIKEYHDGLAVSDYVNMLPLGDTCVDRVGDALVQNGGDFGAKTDVRGTFIDSNNMIYIAYGSAIYMAQYHQTTDTVDDFEPMMWYVGGEKTVLNMWNHSGKVTFCESSIKPSIVYCCDGEYIYLWNTTENKTSRIDRDPHIVNMMYLPEMVTGENGSPINDSELVNGEFNIQDSLAGVPGSVSLSNWKNRNVSIDSICWFDNKLVGCDTAKNTVWITRTDPGWYFRELGQNPLNPDGRIDLWYNWYSSTNNADRLIDVASYGGQLYFFNSHSIEVWGRTGNEDSPIQPNTTQVVHFGGRNPLIYEGVLYFIASDSMNDEFIAAFSPQFQKLSNKEIERRLGRPADLQIITQRHENYLFVRNEDCSGFLFKDGRWSSWDSPVNAPYRIRNSIVRDYAVTDSGRLTKFDERIRTTGGVRYNRYIRDGFAQFPKRVIFRRFYVIMDTGKTDRDLYDSEEMRNMEIYAAVSTNRGLSFSQRRYRKLGMAGHNDKMIEWRNLGSGNSFLIEFGTSSLHKLQIYGMGVDTQ
jgi:hypothetical protein